MTEYERTFGQLSNDTKFIEIGPAPLSYGPGSGEWPENFALSLFGVQIL